MEETFIGTKPCMGRKGVGLWLSGMITVPYFSTLKNVLNTCVCITVQFSVLNFLLQDSVYKYPVLFKSVLSQPGSVTSIFLAYVP
jgi:hypothetical protein